MGSDLVRERPILFSGAMVRAIINGSKTQTRRVVQPQPIFGDVGHMFASWQFAKRAEPGYWLWPNCGDLVTRECPFGAPGDRLWVREHWRASSAHDTLPPRDIPNGDTVEYLADGAWRVVNGKDRRASHMPRWASRITIEVTEVRVQRVQETSAEDARAEGIIPHVRGGWWYRKHNPADLDDWDQFGMKTAVNAFEWLWDSINGKRPGYSWADNPWVWCVSFQRLDGGTHD